jgi:hypothetical protein
MAKKIIDQLVDHMLAAPDASLPSEVVHPCKRRWRQCIVQSNGTRLVAEVVKVLIPLPERAAQKARALMAPVLGNDRVDRLFDAIRTIEAVADISSLRPVLLKV